jgi:hypothetical protein
MKILRILLTVAVLVAGLAVLAVLVLIAPAVQTWVAQHELARLPGVSGTLGSMSAGFGEVSVEDLHLEADGAVLALPTLQAKLAVTDAVLRRRARITSLVADGWTLDLSHSTGAANAASVRDMALLLGSLLRPWNLPADLSLDDVEMEGDVLLPSPSATGATHMHLRVTGGGMGSGREGTFTVETTGDVPAVIASSIGAHGNLTVVMDTPRTFRIIRLTAGLTGLGSASQGAVNLCAQAEIPRGGPEILTVSLVRGDRELLSIATHMPTAKDPLAGSWKLGVSDSDVAPFAAGHPLPSFSASGSGTFDSDLDFDSVHVTGGLRGDISALSAVWPVLARVGAMNAEARFELTRASHIVHVVSLAVSLAGASPVAKVRALQAFDIDDRTGALKLADAGTGWLDIMFGSVPLAWMPDLGTGTTLAGNDARGELVLSPSAGGFSVRTKAPLAATAVALTKDGHPLAKGLDLSTSIDADVSPATWQVHLSPLLIASAAGKVASVDAKISRAAGDDQPILATGNWTSDIAAVAAQGVMPALDGFAAGTASGDFTASVTDSVDLQGNILLTAATGRSISSAYHVGLEPDGGASFVIPLKITDGKSVSDLSAEGNWSRSKDGDQIDLKLSGGSISADDLLLLAEPLATAGSGRTNAPAGERDTVPFWGDWTGHVSVSFDRLRLADQDLAVVGGVFDIDHGIIRLSSGHGGPEHHDMTNISGSLAFDPSSATPYTLKATSAPFQADAKALFGVPHSDDLPVFEGHFSVAPSLVGIGINLQDLANRTQGEFRISSTSGIVRLLGSNVATSLHEKSAPVTDTLGTVGSVVGGFLGSEKAGDLGSKNHLSKSAEAALDLGNQLAEIGCDEITLVARRSVDGTFTLSDIDMVAPDEFLRGTGTIAAKKGLGLFDQPLSLDLVVGAKGRVAELLRTAGLADPNKDPKGFTLVSGSIHFGGTLAHIETGDWQRRLAQAATKAP